VATDEWVKFEIERDYGIREGFCVPMNQSSSGGAIIEVCNSTKKQTGLGPARTMRLWLKVQSFDAAPKGFAKKHPRFFVDEIHSG